MQRLIYAFSIMSVLSSPVFADDRCIEQAKAIGYVAPQEMLAPCALKSSEASQEIRVERVEEEKPTQADGSESRPIVQTFRSSEPN